MTPKGYRYTLLLSGFIAVIGTGNYLLSKTDQDSDTPADAQTTIVQQNTQTKQGVSSTSKTNPSTDLSRAGDPNAFLKNIDERLSRVSARQDISAYSEQDIANAINDPKVWGSTNDVAGPELPLDDTEKTDGRSFFQANPARIALSIPGDTLEVYLPNSDIPMELNVEQVKAPGNGVVSLSGQIVNSIDNLNGTFSLTQGNGVIAGHINTNANTYSFEIFDTDGWIHESGALFTGELDPVIDDHDLKEAPQLGQAGEHIIAESTTTQAIDISTEE